MATFVFATILLLAPIVGVVAGHKLVQRAPKIRWGIFAGAVLALGAALLVTKLSFLYTGPRTYPAWTTAWLVQRSSLVLFTAPAWVSLAIFQALAVKLRYRTWMALTIGYLSILPTLVLLMVVGCNQTGACF